MSSDEEKNEAEILQPSSSEDPTKDNPEKKSTSIATPSLDLEFRKANEAIGLRVSEGKLTLLSRKIFNALVCNAQKVGEPGKDAPIKSEVSAQYFWVGMSDIAKNSDYDSNDTLLLKEHLEELQNIKLIMEDDKQWTSERLVSSVKIVNPAGLNKKGGKLWIGYAFPPEVASLILNPSTYTKLSIYYITQLRSGASVALYEVCRRYLSNPTHVTSRESWEWWYEVLSGNPISEGLPEYKYFKRDLMKGSIAEINAITDIQIELLEFKQGRKVVELQFKVYPNEQQSLEFPAAPIIDGALILRLMNLGFKKKEASDLFASTEDAILRSTLQHVEERMLNKKVEPIEHPAAYFRDALRRGYAKKPSILNESAKGNTKPKVVELERKPTLRERFTAQSKIEAERYFNELDEVIRNELVQKFIVVADKGILQYLRKTGIKTKIAHTAFTEWLALDLWGEPTDAQLLAFADSHLK